jgi:hypothetical protein
MRRSSLNTKHGLITRRLAEGCSMRQLSRELEVDRPNLSRYVKRHNLMPRERVGQQAPRRTAISFEQLPPEVQCDISDLIIALAEAGFGDDNEGNWNEDRFLPPDDTDCSYSCSTECDTPESSPIRCELSALEHVSQKPQYDPYGPMTDAEACNEKSRIIMTCH